MRRWMKWLGLVLVVVVGGALLGLDVVAAREEDRRNRVYPRKPYQAPERAVRLHQRLVVADLHADPLLWGRDLNERSEAGHVDVPRLLEGNVALQVFGVVTKVPERMNVERNSGRTDQIRLLAVAKRWPPSTWDSLLQRALYQAERLADMAEDSEGRLVLVRTRGELERFLEQRRTEPGKVAGLLGLEGTHALEGKAENVEVLYEAGFRMLGLAHFFDNEVGGSAHGEKRHGLTPLGREVVRRMEARGMTVDLAHSSAKVFDEVLSLATRPVVVSHTGVRGTCNNNRNLSDEQLRKVARNGGVVGIGYWETATCGKDAAAIARAIRYAVRVAGEDHVGLGSDYDGAVTVPFDTAGLVELTAALQAAGLSEAQIEKIMGGNALRVLRHNLPEG